MVEFQKSDGNVGACGCCNRRLVKNERYKEMRGGRFDAACSKRIEAIEHLFSNSIDIIELARTQHRLAIGAQTKAGWARYKARKAAERVDDQTLLAMGM